MNLDIAKKWTTALRSGTYEQGTKVLCRIADGTGKPLDKPQWCCLGVLCDILNVSKQPTMSGDRSIVFAADGFATDSCLPPAVFEQAGFNSPANSEDGEEVELPEPMPKKIANTAHSVVHQLTGMNDYGYTFEEIADYIDKHAAAL